MCSIVVCAPARYLQAAAAPCLLSEPKRRHPALQKGHNSQLIHSLRQPYQTLPATSCTSHRPPQHHAAAPSPLPCPCPAGPGLVHVIFLRGGMSARRLAAAGPCALAPCGPPAAAADAGAAAAPATAPWAPAAGAAAAAAAGAAAPGAGCGLALKTEEGPGAIDACGAGRLGFRDTRMGAPRKMEPERPRAVRALSTPANSTKAVPRGIMENLSRSTVTRLMGPHGLQVEGQARRSYVDKAHDRGTQAQFALHLSECFGPALTH